MSDSNHYDVTLDQLAHDEQLNRPVVSTVPHAKPISNLEDAKAYLAAARAAAGAMHFPQKQEMVHRDVNPANILNGIHPEFYSLNSTFQAT